jgi:hypothetical protein
MSMQIVYNGAHLLFGLPSRLLNPFALITVNFRHVSIKKEVRSARTCATNPQPLRGPYGVVAVGVRLIR